MRPWSRRVGSRSEMTFRCGRHQAGSTRTFIRAHLGCRPTARARPANFMLPVGSARLRREHAPASLCVAAAGCQIVEVHGHRLIAFPENGSKASKCGVGDENLWLPAFAASGRLLDRDACVRRDDHLLVRSRCVRAGVRRAARGWFSSACGWRLAQETAPRLNASVSSWLCPEVCPQTV
jgi:hypothetical protein